MEWVIGDYWRRTRSSPRRRVIFLVVQVLQEGEGVLAGGAYDVAGLGDGDLAVFPQAAGHLGLEPLVGRDVKDHALGRADHPALVREQRKQVGGEGWSVHGKSVALQHCHELVHGRALLVADGDDVVRQAQRAGVIRNGAVFGELRNDELGKVASQAKPTAELLAGHADAQGIVGVEGGERLLRLG